MTIPRSVQQELEQRDEMILALEMLTVDQACRLLALEAVLRASLSPENPPDAARIEAHIVSAVERFRQHFEGESMTGFTDRARRMAAEFLDSDGA